MIPIGRIALFALAASAAGSAAFLTPVFGKTTCFNGYNCTGSANCTSMSGANCRTVGGAGGGAFNLCEGYCMSCGAGLTYPKCVTAAATKQCGFEGGDPACGGTGTYQRCAKVQVTQGYTCSGGCSGAQTPFGSCGIKSCS